MTETEKRRTELLEQTRQLYTEQYSPPAIHPRYRSVYQSLYKNDVKANRRSTFAIRLFVAVLIFGLFAIASKNEWKETTMVTNEITRNIWEDIVK